MWALDPSPLGAGGRGRGESPPTSLRPMSPELGTKNQDHNLCSLFVFQEGGSPKWCGRDHETFNYKKKILFDPKQLLGEITCEHLEYAVLTSRRASSHHNLASAIPWEGGPSCPRCESIL